MKKNDMPESTYVKTWSKGNGDVKFFTRADGSRLRYFTTGTGSPLVLLHTVRSQLDYFQRIIPLLQDSFTIYALDLPGMGWSDIVAGAKYDEPEMRSAVVEFVSGLNLAGVTLAGESLGAAIALSASVDLKSRVSKIVALNSYDYPSGVERGNLIARFVISSIRMPIIGPIVAMQEPKPIVRAILLGGYEDKSKLPNDFLDELLRSGRRPGYSRVARAVYRSLPSFIAARERYKEISAPVTLVYSEHDWSRAPERDSVASLLSNVQRVTIPGAGHFSSLERPSEIANVLLGNSLESRL